MKKFHSPYKCILSFLVFSCFVIALSGASVRAYAGCEKRPSGDVVCDQPGSGQKNNSSGSGKNNNSGPIYNNSGSVYVPPKFPSNVQPGYHMDMYNLGTQILMPTTAKTTSSSFTTTNNPEFFGKMAFGASVATTHITRLVWISTTPGGSPLSHPACSRKGTLSTIINFTQSSDGPDWRCPLELNTRYFLNVKVLNCPTAGGCPTYRIIYHNKA